MPCEHGTGWERDCLWAWAWLPIILLLSYRMQFGLIDPSAPWLVLPLALWLGQRYGKMGLAVVALGGLGLPLHFSSEFIILPGHPDVYLAALFLAWLASRPEPLQSLACRHLPPWSLPLIFGLLALSLGLWGQYYGGGIELWVLLHFKVLLYLFVFSLGLSRVPLSFALGSLLAVTLIGMLLDALKLPRDAAVWLDANRADLPLLGLIELKYLRLDLIMDTPAEFLAATGYLLFGRSLRDAQFAVTKQAMHMGLAAALVLALLLLGRELNLWLLYNTPVDADYRSWMVPAQRRWFGVAEAIPLAALIAGRYLGYPGLVALLAGVVAIWSLEGWLRAGFELSRFRLAISLSIPLYVFGFGSLGVQIRALLEHRTVSWWSNAWAFYLLLVLIVLLELWWPLEVPLDILWLCILFVVITGASLLVTRLWQWLAPLRKRHTGWLALISLCLLLYSVLANYQAAWDALRALGDYVRQLWLLALGKQVDLELDNRMLFASLTLLGLGVILFAVRAVLATVSDLRDDMVKLRDRLTGLHHEREGASASDDGTGKQLKTTIAAVFNRWLGRLGWACVVVALLLPAIVGGQTAWQSYKKIQAREAKHMARTSQTLERSQQSEENIDHLLIAAVEEFTASWPTTRLHTGYRHTSYDIDWYQHPDYPGERLSIRLSVETPYTRRTDMSVNKRRQRALGVYVSRLEQGRFGLWVETRSGENRQREKIIATQIEESIVTRAGQLSNGEQLGSPP